ncbi:MAG TPA: hypothetical protein PKN02_11155, partial [Thermotogota bacterium]|nr:hypothetical protein [Thermotogota bacterium]
MIYGNRIYNQDIYEKDRGETASVAVISKERIARTDEEILSIIREPVTDTTPITGAIRERVNEMASISGNLRAIALELETLNATTRQRVTALDAMNAVIRSEIYEIGEAREIA